MHVVICGAGEIGSHAAEVLADRDADIVVVDLDPVRLAAIGDTLDVGTLVGNCARADVLAEADCAHADLFLAATDQDEVNLLAASLARGLGARRTMARVHHGAYFRQSGLDYQAHLGIDRMICPEYATAQAIARRLRNPGAIAIENFGRGRIEMQELVAGGRGSALGKRLVDVRLPTGTRLLMIRRKGEPSLPEATSVIVPGDTIVLVGNADVFDDARKLFQDERPPRKKIAIMGGPSMAVWLCRSLHDRAFSVRLFEKDRERARELGEKLPWVTVLSADPTDRVVFDEENLAQADVFITLLDEDEANIIAGVLAKIRGTNTVITVVQKSKYLDLAYDIGVDIAFSTRHVAAQEIDMLLDESPIRRLGSLAEGAVEVHRVKVAEDAPAAAVTLRELPLAKHWVIAALQRGEEAWVPGADDVTEPGDEILIVGPADDEALEELAPLFGAP